MRKNHPRFFDEKSNTGLGFEIRQQQQKCQGVTWDLVTFVIVVPQDQLPAQEIGEVQATQQKNDKYVVISQNSKLDVGSSCCHSLGGFETRVEEFTGPGPS